MKAYKTKKQEQIEKIFKNRANFIAGCCSVFKREINELYLPLPKHNQSYDVWLNFICQTLSKRQLSRKVLQLYRRHDKNNSETVFNNVKYLSPFKIILIKIKLFVDEFFKRQKTLNINILNNQVLLKRVIKSRYFHSDANIKLINNSLSKLNKEKKLYQKIFFKE